ncbi:MAG: CC/Se motif family (seleno)protein [Negativicutes bacterium]
MNLGPSVRLGVPHNPEKYKVSKINGILVYVPVAFESPFDLRIVLRKFFWFKSLHIEGWKII